MKNDLRIPLEDFSGWLAGIGTYNLEWLSEKLSLWRNRCLDAFAPSSPITPESTRKWINEVVIPDPNKILYLVEADDAGPVLVGHLGFVIHGTELELDNVVKGEPGYPGIMSAAVRALLLLGRRQHSPTRIYLRVVETNKHAVEFYEKLGFTHNGKTDIRGTPAIIMELQNGKDL